jgi:hypothetical protein
VTRAAIAIATAVAAVLGQASAGSLAGSWAASLSGRTFVRLELHETDGALNGRISLADIHVNADGSDGVLSFARKDGADTDRFSVRLSAAGFAELSLTPSDEDRRQLAEAGIPIPRPIRLTRVGP